MNHPPHILTEASESTLSSSSFIPFCQFGDSLSVLGQAAPQFRQPVCSGFSEGVLEGQVCYSLDLNTLRPGLEWRDSMQFGLGLLLDTNTELDRRQMYFRNSNPDMKREASLTNLVRFEDSSKVKIQLHTLGRLLFLINISSSLFSQSQSSCTVGVSTP